jgi:hypothetical protein
MRSSDSQENEVPDWDDEEGSDQRMDPAVLKKVKESSEHLYEQEEEPADRPGP